MPLLVAATPIGNVGDASDRLREALATADVIAAEDTRRLRRLLAALAINPTGRIVSHHDHNEAARLDELLAVVQGGGTVVVVTDAGTPLVSDPGYRLVEQAAALNLPISAIPGPSAALAALAVSGLPADRWCFEGFPPRKVGDRRRLFAGLASERRTLVFFEAPHRLAPMLADLQAAFGPDRRAAVCRELTKTYEEVRRGSLAELAQWAGGEVRGEITLVVAGASDAVVELGDDAIAAALRDRLSAGDSRRDAVDTVSAVLQVSRRRVYEIAVGLR